VDILVSVEFLLDLLRSMAQKRIGGDEY